MAIPSIAERFKDKLSNKYPERTVTTYMGCYYSFRKHFSGRDLKKIAEWEIDKYLLTLERSHRKQMKSVVNKLYLYIFGQRVKIKNTPMPPPSDFRHETWTPAEIQALLNVIENKKHKSLVWLYYSTGCRLNEILNVKFTDISHEENVIQVLGKGGKYRYVKLEPNLIPLLEAYIQEEKNAPAVYLFENPKTPGKKYSGGSVRKILLRYSKKAGFTKHIHPHLLRHSIAQEIYDTGESITDAQDFLGHASQRSTRVYARKSKRRVQQMVTPASDLK